MRTPWIALPALAAAAALGLAASGCGTRDRAGAANAAAPGGAAATATAQPPTTPAPTRPASAAPANDVTIGAEHNGGHVPLRRGQTLVVRLAGDPGTGYAWTVKQVNRRVLRQDGAVTFAPSATPRPGNGGFFTVRFTAARPGATWLRLGYGRAFGPVRPPAATFAAHIMVT